MNKILESIEPVIETSKDVRINNDRLRSVCSSLEIEDTENWLDLCPVSLPQDERRVGFIFVLNALNFCYWGSPKWAFEYRGEKYDGAYGMISALKKALDDGIPVTDPRYLSTLGNDVLAKIFQGNVTIPLFEERHRILQELGQVLVKQFDGSVEKIIQESKRDALLLLDLVTENFPSYDDHVWYDGRKILFHKRAQLLVSDINDLLWSRGHEGIERIDQLTAAADYKLPQALRKIGILEYSRSLAERVDGMIELSFGSKEEIEIRANTIWAVELMRQGLKKRFPNVMARDVDNYLWIQGQKKSPEDTPYHLTRTIAY